MPGGVVFADTGPIRYLIMIGHIDVLSQMFGVITVPAMVAGELRHQDAPGAVRAWAASPPLWLVVRDDPAVEPTPLGRLDPGERAAIALAQALGAGLLLIDDRAGALAARNAGLRVTGTIGVLVEAARRGILDLAAAFEALRDTIFPVPTGSARGVACGGAAGRQRMNSAEPLPTRRLPQKRSLPGNFCGAVRFA